MAWDCQTEQRAAAGAFTLVELLVVMAIVGVLAALLLQGLSKAEAQGKRVRCLNNHKQLALCVHMYAADNDGKLPENAPGNQSATPWVSGNMLLPQEATNQALLRQGKLFPYANHVSLYKCPADLSRTNGWLRLRSYSMNGWMGSRYMESYPQNGGFRTFLRESELSVAGPTRLWLLIDEHEASINDPWFLVTMDDSQPFSSFPATRHHLAYTLSFADGHVETYKLRDPETQKLSVPGTAVAFSAKNADWLRLKQVTTVH